MQAAVARCTMPERPSCPDCETNLSTSGKQGVGYCPDCDAEHELSEAYSEMQFTDGGRDTDDDLDDEQEDESDDRLPPGWRDGPPDDALRPPGWENWDREAKLNYLTLGHTRADILAHIRGFIGSSRGSDRLDKNELAMIALDLEAM